MRFAELKPELPFLSFPSRPTGKALDSSERPRMNTSRPRSDDMPRSKARSWYQTDIFDGDDLDFEEFLAAGTFLFIYNTNLTHSKQIRERIGRTSTIKLLALLKKQLGMKAICRMDLESYPGISKSQLVSKTEDGRVTTSARTRQRNWLPLYL